MRDSWVPSRSGVFAALAVAVTSASFASILIRFAQPYAPSLVIAAYRLSFAAALIWPAYLVRRIRHRETLRRRDVALAMASGVFLAVHFGTWITSLAFTSVASSAVLVATAPLFVALLSPAVLGERVPARLFAGLGLGLLGILAIGASDVCSLDGAVSCPPPAALLGGESIRGDLLALAGAMAGAGYLLIGRSVRRRMPLLSYITVTYSIAAMALVAASAAAGLPLRGYPTPALGLFLLLAIFPQLLAHSTYNWALRYLPAAPVALTLLAEPVGATALAILLLGESPESVEWIGIALILAGIWMGARETTRRGDRDGSDG